MSNEISLDKVKAAESKLREVSGYDEGGLVTIIEQDGSGTIEWWLFGELDRRIRFATTAQANEMLDRLIDDPGPMIGAPGTY